MAILKLKTFHDFAGSIQVTRYMEKKSRYEAIDVIAKRLKKINRKLARMIADDIINHYDIEIVQRITAKDIDPIIIIAYRRKYKFPRNK